MIVILGPTATGKTALAAGIAHELDGEVISADSRQVYRGMDLGTGKDLKDYLVNGKTVPYHLIDIAEPGEEYNIFRFQQDFLEAYREIMQRKKTPVLCGGSGMYLESVLMGYDLIKADPDPAIDLGLKTKTDEELVRILRSYKKLHNKTDTEDRQRLIRAIEIAHVTRAIEARGKFPEIPSVVFGILFPRKLLVERIGARLQKRLEAGMIDEVRALLDKGVPASQLIRYGLEYRYLTLLVTGKIGYEKMFQSLFTAIRQFSKRQMTWFRRMERNGVNIRWIDGILPLPEKIRKIQEIFNN